MIVNVCASSRNSRDLWYVPSNYFITEDRLKSLPKDVINSKKSTKDTKKNQKMGKTFAWIQKLKSKLISKKTV